MALQKAITDPRSGATATYWRLAAIRIDPRTMTGMLVLDGYADRQYRDRPDGQRIAERQYPIDQTGFVQLATTPAQGSTVFAVIATAAYNWIKAAPLIVPGQPPQPPEFADAQDV